MAVKIAVEMKTQTIDKDQEEYNEVVGSDPERGLCRQCWKSERDAKIIVSILKETKVPLS